MKLASFKNDHISSYGIVTDTGIIDLGARLKPEVENLKALIAADFAGINEIAQQQTADFGLDQVELLPVIPNPGATWCAGLNTHSHYHEAKAAMGFTELPAVPMFFLRANNTLVGSGQPIEKPQLEPAFDYEGEIAIIIGKRCRNVSVKDASAHIAGYSCFNDGSARKYQISSAQVTTGKNAYHSAGFGPWMVTADEIDMDDLLLTTHVNGELRQSMKVDDLIFSFAQLISHISEITWLEPGDVIVTGSAEGAGALMQPPKFLQAGDLVEIEVNSIGKLTNTVVAQPL